MFLYYLSFVIFNNFFIISVAKEIIKLKLALLIPAGAPITLLKETIDIPPPAADKPIIALSK